MNQSTGPIVASPGQSPTVVVENDASDAVSLADILRALVKNKWLILACTIICLGVSVVYVTLAKPVYEAAGTIRIDPERAGSLGLSDLLSMQGAGSGEQIQTEMAILKSDQIGLATLDSLSPAEFKAYAGFDKGNMDFSGQQLSRAQEGLLRGFEGAVGTKEVEGTQLVSISFRNGNPAVAATMVNHLVASYLHQSFDSRHDSVTQVRAWLGGQMDELRARANAAQRKLADFQEKNNLLGVDPQNNTTVDRLKDLNTRLTDAEGDRILKEAQVRAAATGDPAVIASLVPDPKLQALQDQEGALYSQYVQLSSKFGPAYPPLVDTKQQLASVKAQIANSVSLVHSRLKEDLSAADNAEGMLRSRYQQEMQKAYALNRTQADYAVLQAEATSSRDLSDTLQYKLQQASVDAGLNSVNTMIVDRARPPLAPIAPKRGLILAFGLLLGAAFGVGAALLREALSDQVQSIEQIEASVGLPGLAVLPRLALLPASTPNGDATSLSTRNSRITSLMEPRSRSAEAYRSMRDSILLSSIDHPPRSILITSCMPGEGKSSTAANFGAVSAQRGGNVLVIDCDLRRPTLHTHFGISNKVGLSNALLGDNPEDAIVSPFADLPNLHILPSGPKVMLPSEALGSARFRSLLEKWEKQYDAVVLDSAPLLTVSDSLPLAKWVDAVVLVVRAEMTTVKALRRVRAILRRTNVRVAGAVLNDFTERLGDYGYYGKAYSAYYN